MEYHVFIKRGEAGPEVEAILEELGATAEAAGLHKQIYVARAHQTVVMLSDPSGPLASALRRKGWQEPAAGAGN